MMSSIRYSYREVLDHANLTLEALGSLSQKIRCDRFLSDWERLSLLQEVEDLAWLMSLDEPAVALSA